MRVSRHLAEGSDASLFGEEFAKRAHLSLGPFGGSRQSASVLVAANALVSEVQSAASNLDRTRSSLRTGGAGYTGATPGDERDVFLAWEGGPGADCSLVSIALSDIAPIR